jgi:hypothetical protein
MSGCATVAGMEDERQLFLVRFGPRLGSSRVAAAADAGEAEALVRIAHAYLIGDDEPVSVEPLPPAARRVNRRAGQRSDVD